MFHNRYITQSLIRFVRMGVLGLFILVVILQGINQFVIREVKAEGVSATISINTDTMPNNLLFFPSDTVSSTLKKEYPQFESITIEKKWPDTLIVRFTPRVPVAILSDTLRMVAIDRDGYVIGDSSDTTLPIIRTSTVVSATGNQIEDRSIRISLAFLTEMGQDDGIREMIIGEDRNIVVRMQDMIIYLNGDDTGKDDAWTLQRLLAGFRIKGSLPKSIDLRFSKPVIQL